MNNRIDSLLQELSENKNKLKDLISKIEYLIDQIDHIIPKDYKPTNRYIWEDRIKLITPLFDTALRYRSELSKLLKEEISLAKEFYSTEISTDDFKKSVSLLSPEDARKLLEDLIKTTKEIKEVTEASNNG